MERKTWTFINTTNLTVSGSSTYGNSAYTNILVTNMSVANLNAYGLTNTIGNITIGSALTTGNVNIQNSASSSTGNLIIGSKYRQSRSQR